MSNRKYRHHLDQIPTFCWCYLGLGDTLIFLNQREIISFTIPIVKTTDLILKVSYFYPLIDEP